ncbi:hypothetical protein HMPREF3224_01872 [Anaerococcus hydrogenalis]|nr:hypothetical protein HMPREF3224_01872 [Anaerococcus hydrogenalis]
MIGMFIPIYRMEGVERSRALSEFNNKVSIYEIILKILKQK